MFVCVAGKPKKDIKNFTHQKLFAVLSVKEIMQAEDFNKNIDHQVTNLQLTVGRSLLVYKLLLKFSFPGEIEIYEINQSINQ